MTLPMSKNRLAAIELRSRIGLVKGEYYHLTEFAPRIQASTGQEIEN
jgi:hypothetical protein